MNGESKQRRGRFRELVSRELCRYRSAIGLRPFFSALVFEVGFCCLFLAQLTANLRTHWWIRYGLYHVANFFHWRYSVYLDPSTSIGGGLYLAHACGIVVDRRELQHCTACHNRLQKSQEACRLPSHRRSRLYLIGPHAVVIGAIMVGNDAAIGANAAVTRDVPDFAVVA